MIEKYINNINKNLQELVLLIQDNPDLDILFLVSYEVVCDDYGYWLGDMERVEVSKYWEYNDRVYTERHYRELLTEIEVCSDIEDDKEFNEYRDKVLADSYKGKAIFIYIGI